MDFQYIFVHFFFSDCLLDLEMFKLYEKIKVFYAEQLYIWGLSRQRLCVLKASSCEESEQDQEEHNNLKMTVDCSNNLTNLVNSKNSSETVIDVTVEEGQEIIHIDQVEDSTDSTGHCGTKGNTSIQCRGCLKPSLYCIICLLPVRGLASCCHKCGHTGHSKHVQIWFRQHQTCPAPGCDCFCYCLH